MKHLAVWRVISQKFMSRSAARLIDCLLAASFSLSLIAYAYLGSYSRYMADDFTALGPVQQHGLLAAQLTWYRGWTGRFAFSFLYSIVAMLGPATPRYLPALLLLLWFAGMLWATYEILSLAGQISWARVVLFASFIIFATLETAPNISQSLYWQTGALTYIAHFIPFSLYVAVIARSVRRKQKHRFLLLCTGILTFVAGGFSDVFVVLQSAGLLLSIIAVELVAGADFKSRIRPFLIAGLVGALLALAIVAAAPGNSIRQAHFVKRLGGWEMLTVTLYDSLRFVAKLVLTHPLIFLSAISLPLMMVLRNLHHSDKTMWDSRLSVRLIVLIPVLVFLLIVCGAGTSVYAISVALPDRSRILLSLVFIFGIMFWSWATGEYLVAKLPERSYEKISLAATVALWLMIVPPLISFGSILAVRDEAQSFAADWDRQDAELRAAKQNGVSDVTVPQISDFQSRIGKGPSDLHLRTDPAFWINEAIATYYGLRSVRANEDVAISNLNEKESHR